MERAHTHPRGLIIIQGDTKNRGILKISTIYIYIYHSTTADNCGFLCKLHDTCRYIQLRSNVLWHPRLQIKSTTPNRNYELQRTTIMHCIPSYLTQRLKIILFSVNSSYPFSSSFCDSSDSDVWSGSTNRHR